MAAAGLIVAAGCGGGGHSAGQAASAATLGTQVVVGSRCPPPLWGSGPRLSPASGRPGRRVTVSGILPHGGGEGGFPAAPATGISVWWNLDAVRWWTALRPPPWPSRPGSPVVQVATAGVRDGCHYTAAFTVPAGSVPGRYRIVVLQAGGRSTASLPPRWFTVLGAPAGRVGLVTDSGLRIRYPAAWYGQVVNGQDALISSTPIHAPALALRETPADGALLSVFDIPPARMSALRGPTPSLPRRLANFAPSNDGIGAAYRVAFTTRGHHVVVFVSLGDAAGRATKHAALAVLRGISADLAASRAWIEGHAAG